MPGARCPVPGHRCPVDVTTYSGLAGGGGGDRAGGAARECVQGQVAAGPAAGTVSEASIDQLSGASIDQQSPAMRAPASTCARQHRYAGASIDQLSRYHTTQYSAVSRRSDAACACPDHVHLSLS